MSSGVKCQLHGSILESQLCHIHIQCVVLIAKIGLRFLQPHPCCLVRPHANLVAYLQTSKYHSQMTPWHQLVICETCKLSSRCSMLPKTHWQRKITNEDSKGAVSQQSVGGGL